MTDKIKKIKAPKIPKSLKKKEWFINEDGELELYDPKAIKKLIEQIGGVNEELLGRAD